METATQQQQEAQYIRLPRSGSKDPIFGLSRSTWNNLILPTVANRHQPPIRSVSLRRNGALRGTRLIVVESAIAFFNKLEAEQNPPTSPEEAQGTKTNFEAQRLESAASPKNPGGLDQKTKSTGSQPHERLAPSAGEYVVANI